jgi:hypothetical protein
MMQETGDTSPHSSTGSTECIIFSFGLHGLFLHIDASMTEVISFRE